MTDRMAPDAFIPVDSDTPAWKRLISHSLPQHEVFSLIGTITKEEIKVIRGLGDDDVQAFIDRLHEVRSIFFPSRGTI
jgi:hypothetical protein